MAFERDFVSPSISFWNFTQNTLCAPGRMALLIWLKLLPPLPHPIHQDTTYNRS
jgi:hypothetical protein